MGIEDVIARIQRDNAAARDRSQQAVAGLIQQTTDPDADIDIESILQQLNGEDSDDRQSDNEEKPPGQSDGLPAG